MGVNQVLVGDEVKLDLTADTVSEDNLLAGATAHNAAGEPITGAVVTVPVDSELSEISENAIQNQAVAKAINGGELLRGSTGYTVNDSVEYPIVGLKLFGNSEQKQYSGKNLFDRNKIYKSDSFQGEDGSYGTNLNFSVYSIIVKNNTKYVLSIDATNFFDNANVRIHSVDENDNWISQLRSFPIPERGKYSFEFTTTSTKIHISILHSHYDVQLELGSTATDYEPYVGGIPSPNLDYPQEIVSVVEPTVTVNNDTNNVSLPLQYTLNAIPVSTGGNVTIDGQRYIADYVDFEEGKYHRLVDPDKLDPTVSIVDNLDLLLETEEITDIPEAEMQAFKQLQTYNGTTKIINDKGAGIEVKYCTSKALSECVAPITKNMQKQIDDLKAAVLSLGGNV